MTPPSKENSVDTRAIPFRFQKNNFHLIYPWEWKALRLTEMCILPCTSKAKNAKENSKTTSFGEKFCSQLRTHSLSQITLSLLNDYPGLGVPEIDRSLKISSF